MNNSTNYVIMGQSISYWSMNMTAPYGMVALGVVRPAFTNGQVAPQITQTQSSTQLNRIPQQSKSS